MSDYPAGHSNIDNGEEIDSPAINEALIATLLDRVYVAQVEYRATLRELEKATGISCSQTTYWSAVTVDEIITEMEKRQ